MPVFSLCVEFGNSEYSFLPFLWYRKTLFLGGVIIAEIGNVRIFTRSSTTIGVNKLPIGAVYKAKYLTFCR